MRWLLLLVAFFWSSVALGNAADCYWSIQRVGDGSEPFTIRVTYDSGHQADFGVGDHLPSGCNVASYESVGPWGTGLKLVPPSCYGNPGYYVVIQSLGNGAIWWGGQVMGCGQCDTECSAQDPGGSGTPGAPNPNNPLPGAHPDPDGDDDGDGVRNECDPDEVQCWDVDLDGICDYCGNDYEPEEDDDGDGVPNDCDPDYTECDDFNDDGCCDYCTPAQCGGEEDPCPPTDPNYPDCDEEDDCPECNPCPRLDMIIAILGRWDAYGVPVNLGRGDGP